VAQKIADVESVEPAEIPLERKPRKKKIPGRKKTDKGDGLRELGRRYEALLKDTFSELNTDRLYEGFSVHCQVMLGYYPGTLMFSAELKKGAALIYRIEQYAVHYPQDVRNAAIDLYSEMTYRGLELAELFGV
jgi:hypothetical protein